MAFDIKLAKAAEHDIEEAVHFISQDSAEQAGKWFEGLFLSLQPLEEMPLSFALIPESEDFARELRSIHYHAHRIVYEVNQATQTVYVVRIYHGARRPLSSEDVP